jgi:hypothetical protein
MQLIQYLRNTTIIIPLTCAVIAGLNVLIQPSQAQAGKSEVVLMMDLDRQVDVNRKTGLETITKTIVERPTTFDRDGCKAYGDNKITKDIIVQFHLTRGESKQKTLLFEQRIGTNLARYWVSDIQQVQYLNQDGNADLVFYMGDDTTDQHVLLLLKEDQVKAVYAGVESLQRGPSIDLKVGEIGGNNGKKLSRWDPRQEVFVGNGIAWVNKHCAPLRKNPDVKGEVIRTPWEHDVVELLPERQGEWQKVRIDDSEIGWINRRHLSETSPTKIFR